MRLRGKKVFNGYQVSSEHLCYYCRKVWLIYAHQFNREELIEIDSYWGFYSTKPVYDEKVYTPHVLECPGLLLRGKVYRGYTEELYRWYFKNGGYVKYDERLKKIIKINPAGQDAQTNGYRDTNEVQEQLLLGTYPERDEGGESTDIESYIGVQLPIFIQLGHSKKQTIT